MKKPTTPSTATALLDLLRKQNHLLTRNLEPMSEKDLCNQLGMPDVYDFDRLLSEIMDNPRFKAQALKIITLCCLSTGRKLEEVEGHFFFKHRLNDYRKTIEKSLSKNQATNKGGHDYKNRSALEGEWSLMNLRTKRLPPDLLIPDKSRGRLGNKVMRAMRLDPDMDEMLSLASAAADVPNTTFLEMLIRHYADSLLRGYIERDFKKETDGRKNAEHLYGVLTKRYGGVATFIGMATNPQVASTLGPDGPKYEPESRAQTDKQPGFTDLVNEVNGLLAEHLADQQELNNRSRQLTELQSEMLAVPEGEQGEKTRKFWLEYLGVAKEALRVKRVNANGAAKEKKKEEEESKTAA